MEVIRRRFAREFSRETASEPAQSPSTAIPRNPDLFNLVHQRSEPSLFRSKAKERSKSLASPDEVRAVPLGSELCRRILAAGTSLLSVGKIVGNVIQPTKAEIMGRKLHLVYSSRTDEYLRPTDVSRGMTKGWKQLVYGERNIELVTEHRFMAWNDVVMTFLARTPGSASAFIQWEFDFSLTGLSIKKLMIKCQHEICDDGYISISLRGDQESAAVPVYGACSLKEIPQAEGWTRFSMVADLGCRRGTCTFKHSKLFYQAQRPSLLEAISAKYPFIVKIYFQ